MAHALRPARLVPPMRLLARRPYGTPSDPERPAWVQRVQQLKDRQPASNSHAARMDELVEEMKRRKAEIRQLAPSVPPETALVPETEPADDEQFDKDAYKRALLEEAKDPSRDTEREPSLWRNALEWLAIAVLFKVLWDFSFSDVNRAYVERKELQRVQEELRQARQGGPRPILTP
eukprot:GGOE01051124.1.p2 GENE.GGOE01051124.1~~GGOE01051124.1.p2  ORF type:complete len:185 (-),score=62.72 GGOE01051124.1:357-884(-)